MNIIDVRDKIPSTNYSKETITPQGITYHITADKNKFQCLNWFKNPKSRVSAHYIIEPDGDIHLCVSPNQKAYHNGIVKKPTAQIIKDNAGINPNSFMIGIEVVANGNDLHDAQFEALKELTLELCSMYNIPLGRYYLIMHREINMIDKRFDCIISYHVSQLIREIIRDKRINTLINKVNMLSTDKEQLKTQLDILQHDNKKSVRIVDKVRDYNKMLLKHIKKISKRKE